MTRQFEPVDLDLWKEIQKLEKKGRVELIMENGISKLFIRVGEYSYIQVPSIHVTQSSLAHHPHLPSTSRSPAVTTNSVTQFLDMPRLNVSTMIEPNPPNQTSSRNKYRNGLEESIFTECSICHEKKSNINGDLLNFSSCGHVFCETCKHPGSNYLQVCPICVSTEPCYFFPSVNASGTSNCALHKSNRAKFYCEECAQFLCSEEDCQLHPVVKIEEISLKNSILASELSSAGAYIEELTIANEAAKSSLLKLDKKSDEIKNKFQTIIDDVLKRKNEIEQAIQAERKTIAKKVLEVSKNVEEAQRRMGLALYIYKITNNYCWTLNIMMFKVYRLGASNVFRNALEMSKNVKNTSQHLQTFRLDFNDDWVPVIVEQLRTLFNDSIESDNFESDASKKSKALREALFSSPRTVQHAENKSNRPEPVAHRKETSNEISELVPPKRQKTVPSSSYSSMLPPVVNYHDNLKSALVNTTYKQQPFTLLTLESQNLVVKTVEKMCEEEKNRLKNMKPCEVRAIVGKQRIRINRLVLELYSKQDRGGFRDVKQEIIKIEPPDALDKEIKQEETSQYG